MDQEEKLIYVIQMHECLYNIKSKYYSDRNAKNNAWQKVGAEMNMSAEDCQKAWKKIRDGFRKSIALRESKSGSARKSERPLKYEKELEFIRPFIKSRKQISNLMSSPEDSDLATDGEYQPLSPRLQWQLSPSPRPPVQSPSPRPQPQQSPSPRPHPQQSPSPRPQSRLSNRTSSSIEQPMSNLLFKQYIEAKRLEDDPIMSFFLTMGRTVRLMPKNIQAKLKGDIFRLVNEAEIRLTDDNSEYRHRDQADFNDETTMPSSSKHQLETTSIRPSTSVKENYNETSVPTTSFSNTPSIIPCTSRNYQEKTAENSYEASSPLQNYSNLTSESSSSFIGPSPPSPYIPYPVSKSQQKSLREGEYEANTEFDY